MRGAGARAPQRAHLSPYHILDVVLGDRDADLVAAELWSLGAVGLEERADRVIAAFTDAASVAVAGAALGGGARATRHELDEHAGLDEWRKFARPVGAGPFVIRPPWVDPVPDAGHDRIDLVIDPGRAFGSGSHPSTRLAVSLLAARVDAGSRVVDVGCGSGVLSVAAALLGADVTAIDTDPAAIEATRHNAAANRVDDRITAVLGDPAVAGPADLAVVNVTIDVHEAVAGVLLAHAAPSTVILSGLLAHQGPRARAAYGGRVTARVESDEWVGMVLDL